MKTFDARLGAWALLLSLLGSPFAPVLPAQTFTNVTATVGLPQVGQSPVGWGDYDNDGRLDLLVGGGVWRNTGSGFTNVTAAVAPGLAGIYPGAVAWGDYDGDGRLDFFITGDRNYAGNHYNVVSEIWRNTGNGFTNVTATVAPGLPALGGASVAWGDYDTDGRLDLLLTGSFVSQVWRNTGINFVNVTDAVAPGLPGVREGSVAWGDYDNDGRLDFIITGGIPRRSDLDDNYPYYTPISQIWRNTGSRFVNVTATVAPALPGAYWSSVAWGDYDNDGRLDFLLAGYNHGSFSQLWRNTGNGFVNVTATVAPGLPGIIQGPIAWGDYDRDGRVDILLSGYLWRNTGSGFTNVTATVAPGLSRVVSSSVAPGDYDSDGRLDFLLTGSTYFYCDGCDAPPTVFQLWQNNTAQSNPPPAVITEVPSNSSPTGATLNARINPRGQAATAWFVWGDSTNYGQVTAAQPMGNGNSFANFSQTISGLSTGVTYYYRAVGSNVQGPVALGVEQRFLLAGPGVTTSPVGEFRPNTATIKGLVTPNNLPTYGWFEWGLTPAFGQMTPVQFLGNGFDATLSQDLYGLAIGTTFYFRAVVSNSLSMAYGATQSLVMFDAPFVCPGSISPSIRSHGNSGGGPYSIYVLLQCDWIVINTNSWITITSATNGTPAGSSLTYTLEANTDLQPRSGNVTIGGHNLFVTQAGANPDCVRHLSPWHVDRGFGAAIATINVTGRTNCPWDVVTTNSWITILSATNGVGSGQIDYAIEANPDMQSRSGYITIGNRGFSITQYGRWYVSLPADQIVALGGTATFSVTVNATPTYQWQFNGVDLVDGGGISGATTSNLVLTAVQYSQGGHYRCVVSGDYISSSATLTVAPTSNALALAEALDTDDISDINEMFFWKTWSNSRGIWFGQTNTTHDGIDAVECSGLAPGEFASLEAKSGGPGLLNFWWKTAFAAPSDQLLFSIGSFQSAALTNTTDWEQRTFTVPPGDVNLRWTLSNSSAGEQSQAWLDQVQFTPCDFRLSPAYNHPFVAINSLAFTGQVTVTAAADCPWHVVNTNSWITILSSVTNHGSGSVTYAVAANPTAASRLGYLIIADLAYSIYQAPGSFTNAGPSLAEALDTAHSLSLSTIGTPAWFGQTIMSRDGADAAQSGPVGDGAAVTVTTAVNQPGTVLFWWKVSSETNKDYLKFFINGVQQTRISGEVDWQLLSYELTSVTNTLKWTYSKNDNEAVGQDRGWLDQVQFIPAAGTGHCVLAISPISATTSANSDTGFVTVVAAAGCAWDVVNTNSWVTHVASPGVGNGFFRYTVSSNNSRNPRTGVISIGGRPFTLTQPGGIPPCSYSLLATGLSHGPPAGSATVTVTTQSDCEWSVWNTNTWITISSSLTNVGSGSVIYSVSSNASYLVRTGQIRIAGQILTVNQSGTPISLEQALDTVGTPLNWTTAVPATDEATANRGTWFGQWDVTHDGVDAAQSGPIPWSGDGSFTTTVTGPGTLTFWWKISSNTNSFLSFSVGGIRQERIMGEVDWQPYSLAITPGVKHLLWDYVQYSPRSSGQNAAWVDQVQYVPTPVCPITITPVNASHPSSSSTGMIDVAAAPDCAWYVSNTNSWISILGGTNGMGNGSVKYSITPNAGASQRFGIFWIANRNFLVIQSGGGTNQPPDCSISISPGSRTHGFASTSNLVFVTTQTGCVWSVVNTNPWVSIRSSLTNSGSGTVIYTLALNANSDERSGNVLIGGQLLRLTQRGTGTNAPRLQIMGHTATNATFSVRGEAGKMYVVESSEDLIHWTPISTNAAPSTVTDAAVGNARQRFYRTVEVP